MSVYSMTGYAGATVSTVENTRSDASPEAPVARFSAVSSASVAVEIRSVNSRFLDLAFRLPDEFRSLEPALRDLLTTTFRRGKLELRLATEVHSASLWPEPQPEQLSRLANLQSRVQGWLPKAQDLSVHEVMQWCKGGALTERLDEVAMEAARRAVHGLLEARAREGAKLTTVLTERLDRLRELAEQVAPLLPAVIQKHQQRFLERWRDALETSGAAQTLSREALEDRAINEAAAYAIRIDVAEELARLTAHLDEISRLLRGGGELGKRLDFLTQELLREANTLASKAASLALTNLSVEMKVAIEQVREQVQNIE